MRTPTAVAALALLTACGGPILYADLQIPDVHLTLPSQAFPGTDTTDPTKWCDPLAPPAPPAPSCITTTLDYDLGANVPILNRDNVTYDLRLTDVSLTLSATEVGRDLAGAKLVTIRILADPADPTSGVVVASYARPPGTTAPTTISVSGNANVDLGPYLRAGRLPVRVELVFDSAMPAFAADVRAGFSVDVKLDYGKLL
jgi:hypothetical protein